MGDLYLQERVTRYENRPGQEPLPIQAFTGVDERFLLPNTFYQVLGFARAKSTDELELTVHMLMVHNQVQVHPNLVNHFY